MPAKIKQQELSQLSRLIRSKGAFFGYMDAVLQRHGCSIKTHYINERGWIVERVKA